MLTDTTHEFRVGDVFDRLAEIPDGSIDLIVTSPPFIALRSYLPADHPDKAREIGSEPTPAAFIDTLLALSAEWRRVLAPHGSLCVELGDTYSGSGGAGGDYNPGGLRDGQGKALGSARTIKGRSRNRNEDTPHHAASGKGWPLAKSLSGIPTIYPWSLAYGRNLLTGHESPAGQWRIRNMIVWARRNPPVGALGDKFRPATSYITVACVGAKRWFDLDAVRLPSSENAHARTAVGVESRQTTGKAANDERRGGNFSTLDTIHSTDGAPPLDWHSDIDDGPNGDKLWWLNTQPYSGAHYAAFPEELPRRLIEAMCPRQVCTACGSPRVRIAHTTNSLGKAVGRNGKSTTWDAYGQERTATVGMSGAPSAIRETTGWTDCGCDALFRPGVVVDPFAGSGTTLAAAQALGRSSIGIDIDDRNAHLASERVGMFLEVTPC
jgi:DNA modification methylase